MRNHGWPGNGSIFWDVDQGYYTAQGGTFMISPTNAASK